MAALLVTGACGKKDEGGKPDEAAGGGGTVVASCDQRAMVGVPIKNCLEYTGSAWTKKEIQARCAMEGQVFLDGACPTDAVVLSCAQMAGEPMAATIRFYEKADKAKAACASIGKPLP